MQSYQLNRRVIQRHQHKIKTYLAVKEYTASNQEELADYLIKQARQTDQITLLVPKVQCFLKEKGILQPALSTLRRLVGKYRDLARREIESNFLNVLKNTVREKLDVLLKVNNRRSILWHLRQTPGVPSVEGILLLIKKLQAIESLGVLTIDLSWLNKNYQQRLARSARYYSVSRVEKLRPGKKYGILVCLCQQLYQDHTDSIIEMLIKLIHKAEKAVNKSMASASKKKKKETLATLHDFMLIGKLILDEEIANADLREVIYESISKELLASKVEQTDNWLESKYNHEFLLLKDRYSYFRQFFPVFLNAIDLINDGLGSENHVLEAINALKTLNLNHDSSWVLSKNLHLDEVAYFWAQLVCERVELLPGWHHAIASHLPFF